MARKRRNRAQKSGLPPGTLVHIGEQRQERVKITVIDYDENKVVEKEIQSLGDLQPFKDSPTVTWINVDGVQDTETVEAIGRMYGLHPLLLEDVCNTEQRPKLDDYGDCLYLVLKMLSYDPTVGEIVDEQVSLVLGPRFVLSFQEDEREGDVFNPTRERISSGKGRIRKLGPDYLIYCMVDAVVDNYFVILENVGEIIESLEEKMIRDPRSETLTHVYQLKRQMITLRRSVWPLREVISRLEKAESTLVTQNSALFFRDVYDHAIQVIDEVETFREMLAGMVELYLSSVSNRMNEVMKVLTIMSTIFIPLTFIAGVYGMNFEHMPELKWEYGYAMVWGIMACAAGTMFWLFRRKKWI